MDEDGPVMVHHTQTDTFLVYFEAGSFDVVLQQFGEYLHYITFAGLGFEYDSHFLRKNLIFKSQKIC
jgi:hypothetical protein